MISFFAKPPYMVNGPNGDRYVRRVSSRVRAEEIATYLGARLNPATDYQTDCCIHVKPQRIEALGPGAWADTLDDTSLLSALAHRPDVGLIAMTDLHAEYLRSVCPENRIVRIPHHHVNFERLVRPTRPVKACGYVGPNTPDSLRLYAEVEKALAEVGLEFRPLTEYQTREDIVAYYLSIDIQVIPMFGFRDTVLRHPTKIVNAASFGIPTVAERRRGFREMDGYYVEAHDLGFLACQAARLTQAHEYERFWQALPQLVESYHIERVAEVYRGLENAEVGR